MYLQLWFGSLHAIHHWSMVMSYPILIRIYTHDRHLGSCSSWRNGKSLNALILSIDRSLLHVGHFY
jgi:hypothetical protein